MLSYLLILGYTNGVNISYIIKQNTNYFQEFLNVLSAIFYCMMFFAATFYTYKLRKEMNMTFFKKPKWLLNFFAKKEESKQDEEYLQMFFTLMK